MIAAAPEALRDVAIAPVAGFTRIIRHEPVGAVFTVAPWNYPYSCAVNSVVPALLAGSAVVRRHSAQTPLCAECFAEGLREAGLPDGVFHVLHLSHANVECVIGDRRISFVAFTGSVEGGHAVQSAASRRFITTGLEPGGKDPAYVRNDADLAHAVENLVDGAMFNSGRSCCGIERIYVRRDMFDDFVQRAVAFTRTYVLANPLDSAATLGPMVGTAAAEFVRAQIAEPLFQGATAHFDPANFAMDRAGTPYLAP